MRKVFTYISSALLAVAVLFPSIASAALPQNVVATKSVASESEVSVDLNQTTVPAYMQTNARYGIMSIGDMPKAGFLSPNYRAELNVPQITAPVPVVPLKDNALSTTFINAFVAVSQNMSAFTGSNFIMQFVPTTASTVKRLSSGYVYANGGAFYADGMYYATYYIMNSTTGAITSVYNYVYNTSTWVRTKSTSVLATKGMSTIALCVSYDAVTEKAYGQFYNQDGTGIVFASIDKNFEVTKIADIAQGGQWLTCAFDGKGNLYATQTNGNLLKVSLTDGKTTLVGNTGLVTPFNTSGTIDVRSGAYYMVIIKADASNNPVSTGVYSVNTATAKATHIYDFDGIAQVYGMYVADPIAEDAAPAAVTDITFNYPEGTLDGAIEFNAPATTYDGEAGKGTLSYYVVFGKDTIGNGNAEYGAKVSVPYKFPSAGKKTVSVTAYNLVGKGPSVAATSGWLGADTPKNPAGLKLQNVNDKIVLSWSPVTEAKNLGYMDASKVTYTVSIYSPENEVLVKSQADTSYVYTPADPYEFKTYSFRVAAMYNGLTSTNTSGSITIGRLTPPYYMEFKNTASLNGYTIINANDDNEYWKYSSYGAAILYQNKRASDDYLITPGMYLEGGKNYIISFQARGWADRYFEQFEVFFGDAPTVEGLTQNLSDTVTIQTTVFTPFEYSVKPEKTGVYYFGFHGISPNIDEKGYLVSNGLYINYLSISAPIDDLAPATPELEAIPDTYGAINAKVNVTAPLKNIKGYTMTVLKEVILYRDNVEIKRFSNIRPGEELTYEDLTPKVGINNYSAVAVNNWGEGFKGTCQAFIGYTTPSNVENFVAEETSKEGEVKLTWDAVTTDLNGLKYREGNVTYTIKDKSGKVVVSGLKETSYTVQALAEGECDFVMYNITAVTAKGNSAIAYSNMLPVGPAYKVPFMETFKDGQLYSPLGYEVSQTNMATLSLANDATLTALGVTSYDGDNGFLSYRFWAVGIMANFFTAKIDLAGVKNPAFAIQTYAFLSTATNKVTINPMHLMAREVGSEDWVSIASYDSYDFSTAGWNQLAGSLAQFKDKVVQVGVVMQCNGLTYSLFDAMTVYDAPDYELEAGDIVVPAGFKPNETQDVTVNVTNLGGKKAEGYNVELFVNGESYAKVEGEAIESFTTAQIAIPVTFNPIAPEELEMYAVVNFANDTDKTNNTTAKVVSAMWYPTLPVINDLVAAKNKDVAANLSWSGPVNPMISGAITDSFESYESFGVDKAGDWTFYDGDKSTVYTINGVTVPNLPYTGSYIILDGSYQGLNGSFAAHAGNKTLACFAAQSGANDDWAISPELNGKAQTVSFYAKTYTAQYGNEAFDFFYSTTGNEPKDFLKLGGDKKVPAEWTEYSYDVPEGTKYFAIRCVSEDQFIFMIDDVTYQAAGSEDVKLTIDGYNVYRDGMKVNETLLKSPKYVDTPDEKGLYFYQVTVVYKQYGESAGSNEVDVEITENGGVDAVVASDVTVSTVAGAIVIYGGEGETAQVVTVDGKLINNALLTGETYVSVAPGVYVVKVNETVVKVVVK